MRKLKFHKKKLLKKVNFLEWKREGDHREAHVMHRYPVFGFMPDGVEASEHIEADEPKKPFSYRDDRSTLGKAEMFMDVSNQTERPKEKWYRREGVLCLAASKRPVPSVRLARVAVRKFLRLGAKIFPHGMDGITRSAIYKALYKSFGGFAADVVAAIDQSSERGASLLTIGGRDPSTSEKSCHRSRSC
ncbi:hypothetical protein L1049_010082 [Liquidambar formosana]|uniref:Uncharacterized protein n=1 Tax=Liquidambar formosana TaxID=63359 RepID=A0AAP0N963_LIQFO